MDSIQSAPNILLVEDDKYVALALKIRLQAAGFEVRIASTATQALEEAAAQPPDIALLDYNLPDGNGVELMQSLLQNEATAGVRSIIVPASKKLGLKEEAITLGAVDFIEKPFKSGRLVDSIRAAANASIH